MKNELLNNINHKDLKIITRKSAEFGDAVSNTLAFPTEFRELQKEYPILFRKNGQTDEFQSVVLLGFEKGQNLFLTDQGWDAHYVPAVINREPFLIGFREEEQDGQMVKVPMVLVNMESPRISTGDEGEPVFLEYGGNSPYLEKVSGLLGVIHEGMEMSKAMFALFEELELIEPVRLEIEFNDREKVDLTGNYTINEEKLRTLDDAALGKLNRTGFLALAHFVLASLSNIQRLIDLRNQVLLKA